MKKNKQDTFDSISCFFHIYLFLCASEKLNKKKVFLGCFLEIYYTKKQNILRKISHCKENISRLKTRTNDLVIPMFTYEKKILLDSKFARCYPSHPCEFRI